MGSPEGRSRQRHIESDLGSAFANIPVARPFGPARDRIAEPTAMQHVRISERSASCACNTSLRLVEFPDVSRLARLLQGH